MNPHAAPQTEPPAPAGAEPMQRPGRPVTIEWKGDPFSLGGLGAINLALNICTLGIYSFWGRTEIRKRVWSCVRINGEPLAYTGTGGEMFKGFLMVFGVVLLPLLAIQVGSIVVFGPKSVVHQIIQVASYVGFIYLLGVASWRARRYRLSRTAWRGIRGTMEGSSWKFGAKSFFSALLYPLTLGWMAPWRANMLQRELSNDTRLGNRPMKYVGTTQGLYGPFSALWFGSIGLYLLLIGGILAQTWVDTDGFKKPQGQVQMSPGAVLGILLLVFLVLFLFSIISGWYRSRLYNHFARSTTYEGARFSLDTTGGGLIALFISNYMMSAFTFGILRPVAEARAMKYFIDRLRLEGPVDLDAIAQNEAAQDRTGEGLATIFDVDVV